MEKNKLSLPAIMIIIVLIGVIVLCLYFIKSKSNASKADTNMINNITASVAVNNTVDKKTNKKSLEEEYPIKDITEEFEEDDILSILTVMKEDDGRYKIYGILFTKLTKTTEQLEKMYQKDGFMYDNMNGKEPRYVDYIVKKSYKDPESSVVYDYAFLQEIDGEEKLALRAVKKDDDTYYIENMSEDYPYEWNEINDRRIIYLPGDTVFEGESGVSTIAEHFGEGYDHIETSNHPIHSYKFGFEDGKCTKVIEYKTCE